MAAQPNMQAALGSLQAARAELVKAIPNKGGHRERAIGFVDSAIAETRAGISYARPLSEAALSTTRPVSA